MKIHQINKVWKQRHYEYAICHLIASGTYLPIKYAWLFLQLHIPYTEGRLTANPHVRLSVLFKNWEHTLLVFYVF